MILVCAWLSVMYLFFYDGKPLMLPSSQPLNREFRKPPTECTFPNTDPFDPALDSVVRSFPPLDCSNQTANIVYLENYVIKVNVSKLHLVLTSGQNFSHCWYKEIFRQKGWDTQVNFSSPSEKFTQSISIPLLNEHIVTECFDTNSTVISRSYFSLIRKKPEVEENLRQKYWEHVKTNSPLETLSFLLIGIDGMSKQNFERAMPKTRNFLIDRMGGIELYKYNKLAFETFQNVLPLLTGHTPEEFYRDWKYNRTGYVDQINEAFLWSETRKLGYRTAMMLDCSSLTAFHYQKVSLTAFHYQKVSLTAFHYQKVSLTAFHYQKVSLTAFHYQKVSLTAFHYQKVSLTAFHYQKVSLTAFHYQKVSLTAFHYQKVSLAAFHYQKVSLTAFHYQKVSLTAFHYQKVSLTAFHYQKVSLTAFHYQKVRWACEYESLRH